MSWLPARRHLLFFGLGRTHEEVKEHLQFTAVIVSDRSGASGDGL